MLNNHQLQQAVRDELSFDPSLTDAGLKVEASGGAVSLSGYVPSYAQKRYATRAAQRVGGVHKVADDIVVRIPPTVTASDDEIAARATQSLAWDASAPEQIRATVEQGVLTLHGTARTQFEKNAAEQNVSRLYGVTGVVNRIALAPNAPTATGYPANITKAIERFAFKGADMQVTADGGRVFLNGTVANAHQRTMAEHAAWSAPGVTHVEDRLTIN